ncbi:hypothetical protein KM043_007262 [Ampulex compressa]|nr:hypothetical protein KM043_007262 [Ampulex compressa]
MLSPSIQRNGLFFASRHAPGNQASRRPQFPSGIRIEDVSCFRPSCEPAFSARDIPLFHPLQGLYRDPLESRRSRSLQTRDPGNSRRPRARSRFRSEDKPCFGLTCQPSSSIRNRPLASCGSGRPLAILSGGWGSRRATKGPREAGCVREAPWTVITGWLPSMKSGSPARTHPVEGAQCT